MKRKDGSGEIGGGTDDGNPKGLNDKRPREDVPGRVEGEVSDPPAPKYGSKEYWEARYKSHLPGVDIVPENAKANGASDRDKNDADAEKSEIVDEGETSRVLDGVVLTKEATKPGHEWYFSYEELRPLIMPLILGNVDDEDSEDESDEDEESWVEEEEEGEYHDGNSEDGSVTHSDGEVNREQSVCDEGTTNTNDASRQLDSTNKTTREETKEPGESDRANPGPKRILEVGCGDKPLGTSLASDLASMQSHTGVDDCLFVVEEVTCIDYSEIVVRGLIENQKREREQDRSASKNPTTQRTTQNANRPELVFRALDARSLPFSSDAYDLVLEKGTLDAMLSDEEEGVHNCVRIVKEMARVTREGGAILIVSHLNANEPKGMDWLQDVVFRGLKDEFLERHRKEKGKKPKKVEASEDDNGEREYVWCVEVHGSDGQYLDANGVEIEGDIDDDAVPIYGPAVYVIRKKGVPASIATELCNKKGKGKHVEGEGKITGKEGIEWNQEEDVMEMPPVKLEFLTYDG